MDRRRLPIGIQALRKLREESPCHVDETQYVERLLNRGARLQRVPCVPPASRGRRSASPPAMKPLLCCLALLVVAAFLATGCRGPVRISVSIARDDRPPDQPPPAVPVVFGATADRHTDPFALNAAAVTGNILAVEVSYAGGCRRHEFVLTAAERFSASSPVQLAMVLTHDANEDPCEAYPTEQLRFDLSPIRQRFGAVYGRNSGTVELHLQPAPDTGRPLIYEF